MKPENKTGWRHARPIAEHDRPFISWLHDRGSLTARLQNMGNFSVQLLQQGLASPTPDEAVTLGLARVRLAWIREVALSCDGQPLVFAHSVLPFRPRGPMTGWLARMGERSLGALLFAHHGFQRGTIECRRIDRRHPLFQPAVAALFLPSNAPKSLWARRSRFTFAKQNVLVTEIFSPKLSGYPKEKSPS